jgi:hypothetical protein
MLETPAGRGGRGQRVFGVVFDGEALSLVKADPDAAAVRLVAIRARGERDLRAIDPGRVTPEGEADLALDGNPGFDRNLDVLRANPKLHLRPLASTWKLRAPLPIHK